MTIPNLSATFFKLFSGGVRQYQSYGSILSSNVSIKCAKLSKGGKKKDEKFSGSGASVARYSHLLESGFEYKRKIGVSHDNPICKQRNV